MLTTTRSPWSLARVYCWFVAPGAALAFATAMLVAVGDGGAATPTYLRLLTAGGMVVLAMLMVALKVWPKCRLVEAAGTPTRRRPARIGGRLFGEGLGVAVGRVSTIPARAQPRVPYLPTPTVPPATVEPRVVDHVYITREDLKDTTAFVGVVGRAPVKVAERLEDAESGALADAAPSPENAADAAEWSLIVDQYRDREPDNDAE